MEKFVVKWIPGDRYSLCQQGLFCLKVGHAEYGPNRGQTIYFDPLATR